MVKERVLVIAPHADDGEFGAGGSIARFAEEEKEINYIAFSGAEKSVPKGMPKDAQRKKETMKATAILGIKRDNVEVLKYPVREFPHYRQDILEDMIRIENDIKPDLVLLPAISDTHQDHQVIAAEGFRAFKKTTMLGYEVPWNNLNFTTSAFIHIEERHLETKINAVKCFITQLGRIYVTEDFIRSLALTRGVQIGTKYAETFEVIRWVVK